MRSRQATDDANTPVARSTPAPPARTADWRRADLHLLPVPMSTACMRASALPHMAALANHVAALTTLEARTDIPVEERLKRLDMLELALSGAFGPAMTQPALRPAVLLRESLLKTGGSFQDMLALSDACRDMLTGQVPANEGALLDHAARAGAPVLRYFLLLHGETREEVLEQADDLARLWFLLRLRAARLANAAGFDTWPDVDDALQDDLLARVATAGRTVADARARTQLWRLVRLARALVPTLRKGRLRLRAPEAATLPPAALLAAQAPPGQRMLTGLRARLACSLFRPVRKKGAS